MAAGSSAGSIFVDLLLRDANYVAGLNRATGSTKKATSQWQSDFRKTQESITNVINPVSNVANAIKSFVVTAAGAFSVQRIIQYSDVWKQMEGRLNIVSSGVADVSRRQQELLEIAQRTRQPLQDVTNFYSRLVQFVPEAERAQYDLLGVTESVASALAITGETSASATGAMIQFTQAIGTNFEAAGQELRSLQEQAPRLTQALMKALGDGTKSLQQLKNEGKLTREAVLNALRGVGEEGRRLAEELVKVPISVRQAFVQLDNAFLVFIGRSDLVKEGTSSLVSIIQALAKNLDFVAKSVVALTSILIVRGVFSLGALGLEFIKTQAAAVAAANSMLRLNSTANTLSVSLNNAQRSVMAFSGGLASTLSPALVVATTRMATFTTLAARAGSVLLSAFGGPVGLAVTAAIVGFTFYTSEAEEAQKKLNEEIMGFSKAMNGYMFASEEAKNKIRQDVNYRIQLYDAELRSLNFLLQAYLQKGVLGRAFQDVLSNIGIGQGSDDIARNISQNAQALGEMKNIIRELDTIDSAVVKPGSSGSGKTKREPVDQIEKWLVKQREALETLRQEADYIGKTSIEIEKLRDARAMEAQIAERSLGLKGKELEAFRKQAEEIKILRQEVIQTNYEMSRSLEAGVSEFFTKYVEDATNSAEQIKGVLERAFKGAEDAFVEFTKTGKLNFKDLANSIIEDLIRIQFQRQAANLVDGLLGGGGSGGGLLGSLLGAVTGVYVPGTMAPPIKPFADGGYLGPGQWGIAGEAGAELIYGGKTGATIFNQDQIGRGGNTYYIDATGADKGAVARVEQALVALAGPGVIEQRVRTAQARSSL